MTAAPVIARDGMLPEWTPQDGVMLTWPHAGTDWAGWLDEVEAVYAAIAREVTRREQLLVVAQDTAHAAHIRDLIARAGGETSAVRFAYAPCHDTWARDHGPIAVREHGQLRLKHFIFNGWGNKWPAEEDDRIVATIAAAGAFAAPVDRVELVMEGGSLESDGAGTILTTSRCLLSPQRNPGLDRAGIERALARHLAARRVLWLEHGHLEGDDTDAHVDTLARFAAEDAIVFQGCQDMHDSHYTEFQQLAAELAALRTPRGEAYRLFELPWPRPQHDPVTGARLPATYANFLIINEAVLAPSYADPADGAARRVLESAFPDREVIMIDCRPIIRGFGSLHCLTMQLPRGTLSA